MTTPGCGSKFERLLRRLWGRVLDRSDCCVHFVLSFVPCVLCVFCLRYMSFVLYNSSLFACVLHNTEENYIPLLVFSYAFSFSLSSVFVCFCLFSVFVVFCWAHDQ